MRRLLSRDPVAVALGVALLVMLGVTAAGARPANHAPGEGSASLSGAVPSSTASATAAAQGMACKGHTIEALHAWEAIVDHAKAENVDLIVMASHGRKGFAALLLGSEAQKVLTHIDLPVLIVK